MLIGSSLHNIDSKGRIIIPAKLRRDLDETAVITYSGREPCLYLYPLTEWEKLEESISRLDPVEAREVRRTLVANAQETDIDTQGRMLVPQDARQYAELEDDVKIIGQTIRVEIWNNDKWNEYRTRKSGEVDAILEKMGF